MDDREFIRGDVPMTKSEVRVVSLSKLQLKKDSILYDVGAGTGSVSVEACLFCEGITVYAIEKNPAAVKLIHMNVEKFKTDNVTVVTGEALEVMKDLPVPTHAFLGGTSGNMKAILKMLYEKNPKIQVVANIISLESLSTLLSFLNESQIQAEIVHLQVSRARVLGPHHMMEGQNPIYIITF